MIYIILFAITICFTFIAEMNFRKNNRTVGIIFSILAVIIPSILAGIRTLDIGIDVQIYVQQNFTTAIYSDSLKECIQSCNTDILYVVINYVISRISNNINLFMFIIELINMILVYIYIYKKRKSIHMWLAVAAYLLVFYNISLNLVRQSLAISVIIFSMTYAENRDFVKYGICVIIATLLHSTAILALPIYFIYNIFNIKNTKKKNILEILIIISAIFVVVNYENIIEFLIYDLRNFIRKI